MTWTSVFFDEVLFCGMDAAFTRSKIYDTDVSFFRRSAFLRHGRRIYEEKNI